MPLEPNSPPRLAPPAGGSKLLLAAALLAFIVALSMVDPVLALGSTGVAAVIVALDRLSPRRRELSDPAGVSRRHGPFPATG